MFTTFIGSEFKKWTRDSLTMFMVVYPIVFALIGRYLLPWADENTAFSLVLFGDFAMAALALLTPMIFGALMGFSILDDRDDGILSAIRVSPLSLGGFLAFRVVLVTLLAFMAGFLVMFVADFGPLTVGETVIIAAVNSLSAPITGFLINAFAGNKIEGFAVMKGTGTLMIFPVIALIFTDAKEFIFSFVPGFWPAKAISVLFRGEGVLNLSYEMYLIIGLFYVLVLNFVVYRIFVRRTRL
ncbi:ABC transporter permease [Isachenkonia alkalipeptolytica]|uniref:ABC transporter permease n=1 Tax=Isachenkonia alkalipeptolytica TaxID=2565777 RepID=A0AA43XIZ0_9CLOT|nr:ABC transporter permease [Isachenkonia alkalipeptolytica]NBG87653.1 ABC transporter permease [Isachenkonia alkalipeptolytica]